MERQAITFVPGLFKASKDIGKEDASDPFISQEALQEYCSLFAPDGIPNNIRADPHVSNIINFSDEDLADVAKIQRQREQREVEAENVEEKKKKEKEAADQQLKRRLDGEVDKIFKSHAFYLKKQCPVQIPYKSTLTHAEHTAYLRAFVKFKIRPAKTAAETAEYENYMRLQHRVFEEQNCFMQFSHKVALLQLPSYNTVPEVITEYISRYVKHRCKRALQYKKHYITEQQIPVCPQDPSKKFCSLSFSHIGHLLSLGTLPRFKLPNPFELNTLKINESIFKLQPPVESEMQERNMLCKTPVSADHNAEYLAQKHQANLVISPSALKVLADNYGPNFDKEWNIPVEVKSYSVTDCDGKEIWHRVVYIDKPMPKKIWTPLDKKQLYFKKAALASMTQNIKIAKFRLHPPAPFKHSQMEKCTGDKSRVGMELAEYDDDFLDLSSTADNDFFGVDSVCERKSVSSPKKKKLKKNNNVAKESPPQIHKKADKAHILIKKSNKEAVQDKAAETSSEVQSCNDNSSLNPEKACSDKGIGDLNTVTGDSQIKADDMLKGVASKKKENSIDSSADIISCNIREMPNMNQISTKDNKNNFLDNLLTMQDSLLKPLQVVNVPIESKDGETHSNSMLKPWAGTLHTNWEAHTQPQTCRPWSGKNVHYQLFSLGLSDTQPNSSSQPLRIIVRHNLHGLSSFKSQTKKSKAYIAYPKPENQPFFGCEVNTLSEITQQWMHLLVRPNTSLLQVRVCESSGEILMTEEKDLTAILREGKQPHVGFLPHKPLAILYSVFTALCGISTGHYLLHHDPSTNAFIHLLKAVDPEKRNNLHTFDLHEAYADGSFSTRTYTVPPWLAIDTHILSPFHLKHEKIPGTFPMKNPSKKLSKSEKKRIKARLQKKKKVEDLDKELKEIC